MGNVSKPLIALLVGTVAFFALWTVALKGGTSGSGGSHSLGTYQSAINKAHQAASLSNAVNAAHGADSASTGATTSQSTGPTTSGSQPASSASVASSTATKPATSSSTATKSVSGAARQRLNKVERALVANKVVALLFFNPAGADDRAVAQELASVPTRGGKVVKLAVPLSEVSHYKVVTDQVPVDSSPTLVLIDPDQQAQTIVGFADRFEIAQRVADALRVK